MDEEKKGLMIFGRDVSKIPCFRNTFLYGIEGGIGVGLITFMFTSRPRLSSHMAMASFTVTCFSYWIHCRYTFSKARFELARVRAGLQEHVKYEGTPRESEIRAENARDV